ncbi:hypothetical protein CSHISOI_02890 [Colletotrichum shisoi]|uniref:Uncharacterized protein n=1 Tax=Colletotrichum shisoi TaxID=2078593 RepID=A0A5Q4BZV2_9PEZI|nr:hypothetical protein CSHISOI_02890 [Colletotrichum shisoi]
MSAGAAVDEDLVAGLDVGDNGLKECILATSRRGGRRPRKFVRVPPADGDALRHRQDAPAASPPSYNNPIAATATAVDDARSSSANNLEGRQGRTLSPPESPGPGTGPGPADGDADGPWSCSPEEGGPSGRPASWPGTSSQPASPDRQSTRSLKSSGDIEGHITSSDLLNPSDALNLLAQVADLDGDDDADDDSDDDEDSHEEVHDLPSSGGIKPGGVHDKRSPKRGSRKPYTQPLSTHYPPISDGILTVSVAARLLTSYIEHFHPFFPVADKCILAHTPATISSLIEAEPHLLTAIFTVTSKDEPSLSRVNEACSRYMEALISKLIYKGSTTVGAVEALLILAQWAPQRLQEKPTVGRGEEDEGAWMQIGVAIRLGYLQSLEQTGLLSDKTSPSSEAFRRKRIVWAACYMSDREVSIRVGKGFWSRGPGPSTIPRSADFPSLRMQEAGSDNYGQLFQAQLELIQLFSNAHDILYSSSSHRAQLYLGGEYVRYIDDFFAVLRKWKIVWGSLNFTPLIKAGLNLSYEFLRLYINAFAFQATINRAITKARQQQQQQQLRAQQYKENRNHTPHQQQQQQHDSVKETPSPRAPAGQATTIDSPLFADLASAPDARFIYESMDAANSLLNILNTSVDPATGLRYMPLKYYLYVIYAAVFLFKARLAGALAVEASESVRRSINITIECLQQSSLSAHSLGQRYARLLSLLWRDKPQEQHQPQQKQQQQQQQQKQQQKQRLQQQPSSFPFAAVAAAAASGHHDDDVNGLKAASMGPGFAPSSSTYPATAPVVPGMSNPAAGAFGVESHAENQHQNQHGFGGMGSGLGHSTMTAFPPQSDVLCRGFSWRDLDDLGQFIGPADMSFSDPANLAAMDGSISLDDGTAYDMLWPGNDVAF